MLATIRDDTWYVHNMQHITPNNKTWDYLEIPVGGTSMIEGPTQQTHHAIMTSFYSQNDVILT